MKKIYYLGIAFVMAIGFSSCEKKVAHEGGVNCNDTIKEGRIWTHTKKSHVVHQELTPEEKELVKDHITNELTFGSSSASIDAEGAKIVNDSRCKK